MKKNIFSNSNLFRLMAAIAISLLSSFNVAAETFCDKSISATTPTSNFELKADGTVIDHSTGLLWQRCLVGQTYNATTTNCDGAPSSVSWQAALQAAQGLNASGGYAGNSDWRLPNVKELSSIVEQQCVLPALNLEVFPEVAITVVWTSTARINDHGAAWNINFRRGAVESFNDQATVRLVRNMIE